MNKVCVQYVLTAGKSLIECTVSCFHSSQDTRGTGITEYAVTAGVEDVV